MYTLYHLWSPGALPLFLLDQSAYEVPLHRMGCKHEYLKPRLLLNLPGRKIPFLPWSWAVRTGPVGSHFSMLGVDI